MVILISRRISHFECMKFTRNVDWYFECSHKNSPCLYICGIRHSTEFSTASFCESWDRRFWSGWYSSPQSPHRLTEPESTVCSETSRFDQSRQQTFFAMRKGRCIGGPCVVPTDRTTMSIVSCRCVLNIHCSQSKHKLSQKNDISSLRFECPTHIGHIITGTGGLEQSKIVKHSGSRLPILMMLWPMFALLWTIWKLACETTTRRQSLESSSSRSLLRGYRHSQMRRVRVKIEIRWKKLFYTQRRTPGRTVDKMLFKRWVSSTSTAVPHVRSSTPPDAIFNEISKSFRFQLTTSQTNERGRC